MNEEINQDNPENFTQEELDLLARHGIDILLKIHERPVRLVDGQLVFCDDNPTLATGTYHPYPTEFQRKLHSLMWRRVRERPVWRSYGKAEPPEPLNSD